MLITHTISLDMMHPDTPPRIQVKQGDTFSRALRILLHCDGEPWPITGDIAPLVRWFACDPDSGETTRGIYDTLPDGTNAMQWSENQIDLILIPQMFALPGLVQADLVLISGEDTLATFNFEFYVNPAPTKGTEPELENYYKFSTLDQINDSLSLLQTNQANIQHHITALELQVDELYQMVNGIQEA